MHPAKTVPPLRDIVHMELRILEHDEAGRDIAAYIYSRSTNRIDFMVSQVLALLSIGGEHAANLYLATT